MAQREQAAGSPPDVRSQPADENLSEWTLARKIPLGEVGTHLFDLILGSVHDQGDHDSVDDNNNLHSRPTANGDRPLGYYLQLEQQLALIGGGGAGFDGGRRAAGNAGYHLPQQLLSGGHHHQLLQPAHGGRLLYHSSGVAGAAPSIARSAGPVFGAFAMPGLGSMPDALTMHSGSRPKIGQQWS